MDKQPKLDMGREWEEERNIKSFSSVVSELDPLFVIEDRKFSSTRREEEGGGARKGTTKFISVTQACFS